ncbi:MULTISPECIES: hypothetical protein [Frankia]|nr:MULTISPECIES: hypothetical protein [Frankia]
MTPRPVGQSAAATAACRPAATGGAAPATSQVPILARRDGVDDR